MVNTSARLAGCPVVPGRATPAPELLLSDPDRIGVLVIGYGNTLRGDDGLGIRVAERLTNSFTRPSAQIMTSHQLTFDMAELISRAQSVVLVDAAVEDTPGAVAYHRIEPQPDQSFSMMHHMEPAALLACTQALYGPVPPTYLWTVTGEAFDFAERLSPAVARVIPHVVTQLERFISTLIDQFQGGQPY